MAILNGIYNLLFSNTEFTGGFWGAFCAFIFFLIGEWVRDIRKSILDSRVEHAYLHSYFNDLYRVILYDKELLLQILEDHKKGDVNISNFVLLPIRDSAVTKSNDVLFTSRMTLHLANIKSLNTDLENINQFRSKMYDNINSPSEKSAINAKGNFKDIMIRLKRFEKKLDFHIEMTKDLASENKYIINNKIFFDIHFVNDEKKFLKRKKAIEKERMLIEKNYDNNRVVIDYFEKARKFGLKNDKN